MLNIWVSTERNVVSSLAELGIQVNSSAVEAARAALGFLVANHPRRCLEWSTKIAEQAMIYREPSDRFWVVTDVLGNLVLVVFDNTTTQQLMSSAPRCQVQVHVVTPLNWRNDLARVEAAFHDMGDAISLLGTQNARFTLDRAMAELAVLAANVEYEPEVYGEGGRRRYFVNRDGSIRYSRSHGSDGARRAKLLGFNVC